MAPSEDLCFLLFTHLCSLFSYCTRLDCDQAYGGSDVMLLQRLSVTTLWFLSLVSLCLSLSQTTCFGGSHALSRPMKKPTGKELRPPANSHISVIVRRCFSPFRKCIPAHSFTAILWETLSQNHSPMLIPDS